MKNKILLSSILLIVSIISSVFSNIPSAKADYEIKDVMATAYNCVYETELAGTQTINKTISGNTYTLKAAFLFGGYGVAMQGTGRTGPGGDYIHYDGSGGTWVQVASMTDEVKKRYADLGITDFTGFGGIALSNPGSAIYSKVTGVIGASGRTLTAWYSIAVDLDTNYRLFALGTKGTVNFQTGKTPDGKASMSFRADDYGGGFTYTKQIDIYVGEGKAAIDTWSNTGGNRLVNIVVTTGGNATVGGIVVPVDKFGLLAPYIGLASTTMIGAVATVAYVKRAKRRKEKQ